MLAACSSGGTGNSAPPANAPSPITNNTTAPEPGTVYTGATGAADAHSAVRAFLDAAKAQDLQAMSAVWGSANGPARNTIPRADLEKRELVLMCFLKHDTDTIGTPSAIAGGKLSFPVTMANSQLSRTTTATVVQGPGAKWYVETIELRPVEALCQRQPG